MHLTWSCADCPDPNWDHPWALCSSLPLFPAMSTTFLERAPELCRSLVKWKSQQAAVLIFSSGMAKKHQFTKSWQEYLNRSLQDNGILSTMEWLAVVLAQRVKNQIKPKLMQLIVQSYWTRAYTVAPLKLRTFLFRFLQSRILLPQHWGYICPTNCMDTSP